MLMTIAVQAAPSDSERIAALERQVAELTAQVKLSPERTFGRAFRTQKQRGSCVRVVGIYRHLSCRKRQPRPRPLGCDSAMPPPARGNVLQGRSHPLPDLPLTFHTGRLKPCFQTAF